MRLLPLLTILSIAGALIVFALDEPTHEADILSLRHARTTVAPAVQLVDHDSGLPVLIDCTTGSVR